MCGSAVCVIHTKHLPSAIANSSPIMFVFMTVGVKSACLFGVSRRKAAWHTYDQDCFDDNLSI